MKPSSTGYAWLETEIRYKTSGWRLCPSQDVNYTADKDRNDKKNIILRTAGEENKFFNRLVWVHDGNDFNVKFPRSVWEQLSFKQKSLQLPKNGIHL